MLKRQSLKNITWIDLDSPTAEEVKQVMGEYTIHHLVAEDLLAPTMRPRLDVYERFIYIVLHFPALRHTHSLTHNQEVDFIVGKNFLITAHYDTIDPLHKFSKMFEVSAILERGTETLGQPQDSAPPSETAEEHAGVLFSALMRKLYGAITHELESVSEALQGVEVNMFRGRERQMVVELSKISRGLLALKQPLAAHPDILDQFREASASFFGQPFAQHAKVLVHEFRRVRALLENSMAILDELRETNNSLVSTKQNEVMKVLTMMAFVTFPLSLIASIFSMSTTYLPFAGHPYDFWIVIGIMGAIALCFFGFFKYKKWL
ncbi:MAG: magnesium transporter CorA family protein [bacterium]|nr:magnesium transporter CorA family protein [bacterium]